MIIAVVIVAVLSVLAAVGLAYLTVRETKEMAQRSENLLWKLCREQQNRISDLENRAATTHWQEYAQLQNHVLNGEDKAVLQERQQEMRVPESWGVSQEDVDEAYRTSQGANLDGGADVFEGPTIG